MDRADQGAAQFVGGFRAARFEQAHPHAFLKFGGGFFGKGGGHNGRRAYAAFEQFHHAPGEGKRFAAPGARRDDFNIQGWPLHDRLGFFWKGKGRDLDGKFIEKGRCFALRFLPCSLLSP